MMKRTGKTTQRVLRMLGSALLLTTLLGAPLSPAPAQSANLAWSDVRPPLTSDNDTNGADGYTALPAFGTTTHAVTVAPNGDLFTSGGTAGAQKVYRSTNGGKNWTVATVTEATAGTIIRHIVVSPDYPTDAFVGVVFSDGTQANTTGDNGFCWVTTWPTGPAGNIGTSSGDCLSFADGGVFLDVMLATIALSSDFNWSNGTGEVAIGGLQEAGPGSVYIAQVSALRDTASAADFLATGDATSGAGDITWSLAYSANEEPRALARLWLDVSAGQTYGEIQNAGAWSGTASAQILSSFGGVCSSTDGQVAFDDTYLLGGPIFAAVTCGGASIGGVYRFDGNSWTNKTVVDGDCNQDFTSLAVSGNASATVIVASVNLSNRVCRTTNEGSSWSDVEVDGGTAVCNDCRIDASGSVTRVAGHRSQPSTVYHTGTATLSGVSASTNGGAGWQDTGLTNLAYTVSSVRELDANRAFAVVAVGGVDAIFYTDTYGPGAGWQRVLRTSRTDLSFGPGLGDLGASGKAFARFTSAITNKILVTTNGGLAWKDALSPDPFENGPDSNELVVAEGIRSGLVAYAGGDKGHVAVTTDGGVNWTVLAKDFGEDIDEFDLTSDPLVFFVTGEDFGGANTVWITRDGGSTFTRIGDTPWGVGDGSIDVDISGYNAAAHTGWVLAVTGGDTSIDEVYRIALPIGDWQDLDLDVSWTSGLCFPTPGSGDGTGLLLWQNAASGGPKLFYTVHPFTGDPAGMTPISGADPAKNLLLELPLPPVTSGVLSTALTLPGFTIQMAAGNRVMELTLPTPFLAAPSLTVPVNGTSVPTNVGPDGIPAVLAWDPVSGANSYQVRIGLAPDLADGVALGTGSGSDPVITSAVTSIAGARFALVPGSTYYWGVQVQSAGGLPVEEGPWSATRSFKVVGATDDGIGGKNLKISTAKMAPGSIDLAWDNGGIQAGYRVMRIDMSLGSTAIVASMGAGAASFGDVTALTGRVYCYAVIPFDSSDAALGISDVECALTGLKSGTVIPTNFTLSLNQSATTTLTWGAPAGGADSFALVVIPLDGSPTSTITLAGATRVYGREEPGGVAACYALIGVKGAAFGNTDLVCGIPGVSTLGKAKAGAGGGPGAKTVGGKKLTLGQALERVRTAVAPLRQGATGVAERAKQATEKGLPNGPGRGGR